MLGNEYESICTLKAVVCRDATKTCKADKLLEKQVANSLAGLSEWIMRQNNGTSKTRVWLVELPNLCDTV
jgi:hypothetical protein